MKYIHNIIEKLSDKISLYKNLFHKREFIIAFLSLSFLGAGFAYFGLSSVFSDTYTRTAFSGALVIYPEFAPEAAHIKTPKFVRAVYMTQCVAGTPKLRERVASLIDDTELNAIVIDIKDYTGTIAFESDHALLRDNKGTGCKISDIESFIASLHKRGIYVIGRITVFQDPWFSVYYPSEAVQKESDKSIWRDYKGLSYVDAGSLKMWDYIAAISNTSWRLGVDELNFDYIRFPSDGNMKDIYYPYSEEIILGNHTTGKAEVLRDFFSYLSKELSDIRKDGAALSADLFGMTMTNKDDLNIGQILEYDEPYFDFVSPMVYPSHYPPRFMGYDNPNHYAYEIVKYSMDKGVARLIAASSTQDKIRPWLQDFDYGGIYDAAKVRAQIQAVYDAGLTSWMLWDPSNIYTREALFEE